MLGPFSSGLYQVDSPAGNARCTEVSWCWAPFPFLFLLSSLELSDTKVYETQIQALPGTASHFCEAVVLNLLGRFSAGPYQVDDFNPPFALSISLSFALSLSLSLARSLSFAQVRSLSISLSLSLYVENSIAEFSNRKGRARANEREGVRKSDSVHERTREMDIYHSDFL